MYAYAVIQLFTENNCIVLRGRPESKCQACKDDAIIKDAERMQRGCKIVRNVNVHNEGNMHRGCTGDAHGRII